MSDTHPRRPAALDDRYELVPFSQATSTERAATLALLCATFHDDPTWIALWPHPIRRHALYRLILEHLRLPGLLRDGHLVRDRTTRNRRALRGIPTLCRIWAVSKAFGKANQAVKHAVEEKGEVWAVHTLGVDTAVRGMGVGSWVVRSVLANQVPKGAPVVLHTQREVNVRFYQRLGFQAVDVCEVLPGNKQVGFTNWAMVKV
ncbi:hypothetical protein GGF32_008912 [Allomyces javanicus]|nr:hypothetical protein GGF32_008912 [Allomyces javanicus]